ncbi:arginase family protein [Actinoplanes sp. NPDC049265]|uniref:arginase family protein n=1 Tax=Actinoplanes sp. NPDC049265 TaxID=3363902 RepID=UPI0037110888
MILVPYHQDERLADDLLPLTTGVRLIEPALPDGDVWSRMVTLHAAAADAIAAEIRADGDTIVLSGDCLVAMATLAGAQRAGHDPAIVWFDAHGDVHTLESSSSGYLGGLSLRLLQGAHADRLATPLGVRPISENRSVLVGARDLDPAEADFLRTSAIARFGVADLDVAKLPDGPLIVHVDVDVIDPSELPGLLFAAPGGPSAADVLQAVRRILDTNRVVALDVACPWHPTTDPAVQQDRAALIEDLTRAF